MLYPDNPVLTNRNLGGYQIQAAGHGDILEDNNGNWWFATLDGWFEIGINTTTPIEVKHQLI